MRRAGHRTERPAAASDPYAGRTAPAAGPGPEPRAGEWSLGSSAVEDGRNGLEQDQRVELQRPPIDVLEVQLHPPLEAHRAAAAHLPETGEPRRHAEAAHQPPLAEATDIANRERARAHQRHLPLE